MTDAELIKVQDEEGNDIELELIETIELDGNEYVILAPAGQEEDAYVYKVVDSPEGKKYVAIEDEDEFERVAEEYESYFDEE
ncbi:hypothetical protein EAL2_c21160 [Peptoclostridium acidaminophilum DSM 3953]|uniref:UPF0473 protein EAL2_c21160 n=1 Tax=Peptoclostridium acidaminophilum DSM 3953 TaxID=1286171 RepID=W8TMG4_PEPAC|nr:DUF1292 domain-containing protein [Peptoclostridium acidaminophilum]AHM57397.1 hypothetical protein EAL2_c21160 [Peptoclostridium acidaminophilum DSM 3953]